MTKSLGICLILVLGISSHSPALRSAEPSGNTEPYSEIAIRIYNHAKVPSPVLECAEQKAARVFHKAGVEIRWIDCSLAHRGNMPECRKGPHGTPLVLKILSRPRANRFESPAGTFGFALLPEDGSSGVHAYIFYHRVIQRAEEPMVSRSLILGHAIAHEVGHLLLGSGNHSRGMGRELGQQLRWYK